MVLVFAGPWVFGGEGPSRVLVIDSERTDRPFWSEFVESFRPALRDGCERPVDVYLENFDLTRFREESYSDRLEGWLTEKYGDIPPDVVVAIGPVAYDWASAWVEQHQPGTPVVFTAVNRLTLESTGRSPHTTGLVTEFGHLRTVELILDLLPETRNLAIVGESWSDGSTSGFLFSQLASTFEDRLHIIDLCGLSVHELGRRVAELPDHTAIVLTSIFADADGRPYSNPEAVEELAPLANAPFFSFFRSELGHGTVGGYLFDATKAGRHTGLLTARVLNGERAESIEPIPGDVNVLAFDWRALRRWGIPTDALPPGSSVEFEPQTLWESHPGELLLALGVLMAQGASIAGLLRSRARRRRANRQLYMLSGRLIAAQEEERRRVARELHDDVSQGLALLAIDLESPGATARIGDAVAKVQALARDVHGIAYEMQPSRLEGAGVGRELTKFCAEVSSRHGLHVDCRVSGDGKNLAADTALALFRVAQEAVQNAVKHSGAAEISVVLAVTPRWASVTVSDNGEGFDAGRTVRHRALGIAGMRERMRLVGGWLSVDSVPGAGATVSAWVPLEAQRDGAAP